MGLPQVKRQQDKPFTLNELKELILQQIIQINRDRLERVETNFSTFVSNSNNESALMSAINQI